MSEFVRTYPNVEAYIANPLNGQDLIEARKVLDEIVAARARRNRRYFLVCTIASALLMLAFFGVGVALHLDVGLLSEQATKSVMIILFVGAFLSYMMGAASKSARSTSHEFGTLQVSIGDQQYIDSDRGIEHLRRSLERNPAEGGGEVPVIGRLQGAVRDLGRESIGFEFRLMLDLMKNTLRDSRSN